MLFGCSVCSIKISAIFSPPISIYFHFFFSCELEFTIIYVYTFLTCQIRCRLVPYKENSSHNAHKKKCGLLRYTKPLFFISAHTSFNKLRPFLCGFFYNFRLISEPYYLILLSHKFIPSHQ